MTSHFNNIQIQVNDIQYIFYDHLFEVNERSNSLVLKVHLLVTNILPIMLCYKQLKGFASLGYFDHIHLVVRCTKIEPNKYTEI